MVAAAIIAAFAILALLIVTALYLKRTTTYKAIISGAGGPADMMNKQQRNAKYDEHQVTRSNYLICGYFRI